MIRRASLALTALVAAAGAVAVTPGAAAAQRTVTCESRTNDRMYCTSDVSGGVRLVRQISQTACISGRTWGTDRRGLWVAYGCRAEFRVGDGYASGGSVWDRARDRNGDGRYDERDRDDRYDDRRDGRYDDRGVRRNERAIANQSERACRQAVRERYRVRNSDVDAVFRRTRDTRLNSVRWTTGRLRGTCMVDNNGRLVRFTADRR